MRAKRFHATIYWMVILAIILAACGGADAPTSEPELPPMEEPTPTPEPIPGRLAINEVMPVAAEGDSPWVELFNAGELSVSTAGVVLTDMDDNSYTIPDGSPMIQAGGLVLIQFDGQGSGMDDYDAGDGLVVLHTPEGLTDPFPPEGDQVALFSSDIFIPDNAIDFVAWARPPVESDNPAVAAGIWSDGVYVNAERGGEITGLSQPGESMGIYPGQPIGYEASWVVYSTSGTTPGESNGIPTTGVLLPHSGAEVLLEGFSLAWYAVPHASSYVLQVDDNVNFDSPEVEMSLEETLYKPEVPPAEGNYYWRVQAMDANGENGAFTAPAEITLIDIALSDFETQAVVPQDLANCVSLENSWVQKISNTVMGSSTNLASFACQAESAVTDLLADLAPPSVGEPRLVRIDGLDTLLQHKDSDMLCWAGDDELGERKPWDGLHKDSPGNIAPHGRKYCARAAIAMINNYYGGNLTQDRISYQHFSTLPTFNELGHDKGLAIDDGAKLLSWAVQRPVTLSMAKPTFAQIQAWVNEGRAVLSGIPGHAIVLRGWGTIAREHPVYPIGTQFVFYNDPARNAVVGQTYASIDLTNTRVPTGTPKGLKLEPTLNQDPDEDDINSFDEVIRFGSDPENADTDFDCVLDQEDMVGFLYDPVNVYNVKWPDWDFDGKVKYLDPDNDNGDVIDGDEDVNWNGHYDLDETSDFDDFDDRERAICSKPFTIFVDNIYYGLRHSVGMSYILPKIYIYGNDPVPMANATVTVRMDGAGSSEQIQITTGDDGSAEGEFTIYSYGTYTLTIENLEGENMVYAPSMNQVTSIMVPVGAAEVPLPEGREETIQAFVAKLSEAFRTSNWGFAIERVHPAVIDLYGAPLCAAYLRDQGDPSFNINVAAVTGPEAWDWERDERVTSLENVFEVTASVTAHDQTTSSSLHFVQAEDGTFRWLTDCGVPSP